MSEWHTPAALAWRDRLGAHWCGVHERARSDSAGQTVRAFAAARCAQCVGRAGGGHIIILCSAQCAVRRFATRGAGRAWGSGVPSACFLRGFPMLRTAVTGQRSRVEMLASLLICDCTLAVCSKCSAGDHEGRQRCHGAPSYSYIAAAASEDDMLDHKLARSLVSYRKIARSRARCLFLVIPLPRPDAHELYSPVYARPVTVQTFSAAACRTLVCAKNLTRYFFRACRVCSRGTCRPSRSSSRASCRWNTTWTASRRCAHICCTPPLSITPSAQCIPSVTGTRHYMGFAVPRTVVDRKHSARIGRSACTVRRTAKA